MATMIDGETYNLRCTITCSKGSGDSKEEFSFTVLEGPKDGKECWLLTENSKWWLFQAPPDLSQPFTIASTHEEFYAQKVTRNGLEQGERRFAWVALAGRTTTLPFPFKEPARPWLWVRPLSATSCSACR
jgi:hypothetical protein